MSLRTNIDKLDQFISRLGPFVLPPRKEIERLRTYGLTESEATQVWRRAIRGRGWTIENIEEIEEEIAGVLAKRKDRPKPVFERARSSPSSRRPQAPSKKSGK